MEKQIIQKLFKQINKKHIISIIYYGNNKGKDIDLCVIVNTSMTYDKIEKNNMDLTIFNEKYFIYLAQLLDPLTTEPILTGKEIYGNRLKYYSNIIKNVKPSVDTIKHLYDFSIQIFIAGKNLYYKNKYQSSMENLYFSLSYIAYANYYSYANKVILFKELMNINHDSILSEVKYYVKQKNKLNKDKINYFINTTNELIKICRNNFHLLYYK